MPKTIHKSYLFIGATLVLLTSFVSIIMGSWTPMLLPVAILGLGITIYDFRLIFYILIFCLPLSVEIYFDNGLGTDLPDEPLMLLLMGVFIIYLIGTGKGIKNEFFWHPITLVLLIHIAWISFTAITSQHLLTSLKFLLAKTWYVTVFYFLAGHILSNKKEILKFIWLIFSALLITVIYTLVRHSFEGFTFASIHNMMFPFFRNHVNYAAMIAIVLPLVWFAKDITVNKKLKYYASKSLFFIVPLFLVAIYLSFTRAAYIAVFLMIIGYFLMRWSLVKVAIISTMIIVPIAVGTIVKNNKFLEYAPEYKKAITHFEFDDLVTATYKFEDVSTMERVYRWVGAYYMILDRPIIGFGPGNFYNFYKQYTIPKFKTYVSANPEKSGIHNYYLMVLVEQGFIGLLLFLAIIVVAFFTAQRVYNNALDKETKTIIMMSFLGLLSILAMLIINDLIESDKIGPLFFIYLALIANADIKTRASLNK